LVVVDRGSPSVTASLVAASWVVASLASAGCNPLASPVPFIAGTYHPSVLRTSLRRGSLAATASELRVFTAIGLRQLGTIET
jgi:hypothetical protein